MSAAATALAPRRTAPVAAGWDTELILLRGEDCARLRDRVLALAEFVAHRPDVALADIASTLSSELIPGGSRLAIVAGSSTDLAVKLRRAADRLADPKCKQIRDSGGMYYFEQPLAEQGTVAVLYPGEGAQYLNMLADLCGLFPEVEETFAWSDQIAANAGTPEKSIRLLLHLPPDATAADRAAAEAELRKLGPSIFGVLIADLAITRILWNLKVPIAAIAGHSAGELAALLAAGAMKSETVLGPRLAETMDMMQRQEEQAGGPDVALLAVGAGKKTVVEIADAVAGGAVLVAMDNCPHQCVAVGPAPLVAAVEAVLAERGLIAERLPFRRPYHTPLFEPWMGPFRAMFAPVPFEKAHTPVYCCSTGELFPDEPDAIRDLTVNHWVSPVEFTRMIETMHADGVRLFVEAGPRGNLSAFVEDILRGKSFAAIPANVPRKSGPTQINHMVAQLVAHHVPLNLGHLYAARETQRVEWEKELSPPMAMGGLPTAAINDYLATMEQFLDVQREVMEAFLGGTGILPVLPQLHRLEAGATQTEASPLLEGGTGILPVLPQLHRLEAGATQTEASPLLEGGTGILPVLPQLHRLEAGATQNELCLIGQIERLEPGREVVVRRTMDEREDLYVDDHTLGGRGVSRVDPCQNGLPVLPMTFSLEAMAEAASLLVPDKIVVAIRNIRLYRWLPFDAEPTTLEVRAAVASVNEKTGVVEVKANVRDLGNTFQPDGANKPSSEAVVVFADRYPDPPEPLPFQLTNEVPCKSSVEDLRRNMFHGPLFQMIRSLGRTGDEGIEGTLEVQPRDRWFRSNPDPQCVFDPVLVDAAMHILGAWHLEQPDWSGRILLPIGVSSLEFFGPIPPIGSTLLVRGHNEEESARQARHGVELFAPDGRLWFRMTGAAYWRFYLPFGDVNFFGPKDQYFLSHRWESAEASAASRCYCLEPPLDLQQPVLRASGVRVTMTPSEIAAFASLAGPDAERSAWFFTRMVAKDAVRAAWNAKHGCGIFPADIEAEVDEHGSYSCRPRESYTAVPFPRVVHAIAGGLVAALAAYSDELGIALVPLSKNAGPDEERTARGRAACLAVANALKIPVEQCRLQSFLGSPTRKQGSEIHPWLARRAPDESFDAKPGHGVTGPHLTGAATVAVGGRIVRVQTAREKNVIGATTLCEAP